MLNDINKVIDRQEISDGHEDILSVDNNTAITAPMATSSIEDDKPAPNKIVATVERFFAMIFKYGYFKSFAIFLGLIFMFVLWQFVNALKYNDLAESIVEKLGKQQVAIEQVEKEKHSQGSALRLENNPKIAKVLTKMLYDLKADRVSILEMHNGKENPTSLPFVYCDMTYEETKDRIPFVAEEYEQMNMSKYLFFPYLMSERIYVGNTETLWGIDKKFAAKVELNDTKYMAVRVLQNEIEIGFLIVSYHEKPDIPEETIRVKLGDYAQKLGFLLDLTHNHQDCINNTMDSQYKNK